ncbi:hypothetical protein [Glycomyces sp. NRRL B-16210]|uniref:hypothetical protein n=1 Tax=Glycomyces sp. NRRL B-16210 TaxID=1463821 RepID=UPI0004C09EF8|nr:hypothetical protein [Glycomyces sp. NRRL B-16210]
MDFRPGPETPPPPHDSPQGPSDDSTVTFQRLPSDPLFSPESLLLEEERTVPRLVGGLGLLVVPLVAAVIAYLLPTLRTIQLSRLENLSAFNPAPESGPANYDRIFDDGLFAQGLAHLAGPIGFMVFTGAVLAPLAAWCLHRAGTTVRTASRVVWSLAAVGFAPSALTFAWLVHRIVGESDHEVSLYDWAGLVSGTVLGLGVLVGLAVQRGTGPKTAAAFTAAGLTALAVTAAGLQMFVFGDVTGLPSDAATPLAQIYTGLRGGLDVGGATAKSVLLLTILAVLGLAAAVLFAATRTRIDVVPGPIEPRGRPAAAIAGAAVLLVLVAAVGFYLLPWLTRLGEDITQGESLWFVIRRTWGPPLVTTGIALTAAAFGGFAIGAVRPLGDASRWLLLLFAPWLFVGTGPLAAAHLEAVAGEGQYTIIGSFPTRAWVAIPVLFVFTALCWALEDRRRAAVADGATTGEARRAFAAAAWPMAALMALVLLLVHVQDQLWKQLTFQDGLTSGAMKWALQRLQFEDSGVGLGFPVPILAVYALAAVAFAIWYLPRLTVRVGR